MMRVVVNGQEHEISPGTTVGDLVALHKLNPRHVAVEVNCELVTRPTYGTTLLREGDQVEIVTLVGGG